MFDLCVQAVREINVCADLFKWSYPFDFIERKVLDGSNEASRRCGDEDYRIYGVFEMPFFHVCNFSLFRDGFSLDF